MMKLCYSLLVLLFWVLPAFSQDARMMAKASERAARSVEIIEQFVALGPDTLPNEYFRKAKAIAVFPSLTKTNVLLNEFLLGNGIMAVRDGEGFGQPIFLVFKGVDLNFKMAAKKDFDAVFLFMDDESVSWIKDGDVAFDTKKRRVGIGPVAPGVGADRTLETCSVIYYALRNGELLDTDLKSNKGFKMVGILHDNNMNKAIFGQKAKALFTAIGVTVPPEIEKFRVRLMGSARDSEAR